MTREDATSSNASAPNASTSNGADSSAAASNANASNANASDANASDANPSNANASDANASDANASDASSASNANASRATTSNASSASTANASSATTANASSARAAERSTVDRAAPRRVLSVVGARPQFVKAFPVAQELRERHDAVLVHTGQHYDEALSAVFFDELDLPRPEYDLGVGSAPHAEQVARMLAELDGVYAAEQPDVVVVYGDTNSTLAGALAATMRGIPLVHVEAGLRSGNRDMPEERNRILTDHVADVLCAPCANAVDTLRAEGIRRGVHQTGDVMYDALRAVRDRAGDTGVRDRLGLTDGEYVLATVHRAGNTDDPGRLAGIVDGLARHPAPVVLPVHPRTEAALREHGLWARANEALRVVEPVGYLAFLDLLSGAARVATDSGGVQKEAFFLDTPCVTLREETEWVETVDAGWNVLVGAAPDRIAEALDRPAPGPPKPQPYGDGNAAARIVDAITDA